MLGFGGRRILFYGVGFGYILYCDGISYEFYVAMVWR